MLARDLWVLWEGRWMDHMLPTELSAREQTLVATVAHGDAFMTARRFACQHNLPLVSFFQDWWPDIAEPHAFAKRVLEQQFRGLAGDSAVALCVSEGMSKALGVASCRVLPPIAASKRSSCRVAGSNVQGRLRVLYSGNLGEYGPMTKQLLEVTEENRLVECEVRGANPVWPEGFARRMRTKNRWLDFAPRAELEHWLAGADAFVVPMVFDKAMRRRMETSFPSKLVEFSQFGKPLIVWGPDYCSAVEWARRNDSALCVTSKDARSVVEAFERLAGDRHLQAKYAAKAAEAAAGEFDPSKIQQQFRRLLEAVLASGPACHQPDD